MGRLPPVSGKQLCKTLEKEGFIFVRQTGSHRIYQKESGEGIVTIPVPVHSNKPLKKGTLLGILKRSGISREKLVFLLALLM
ncbi:MAG: type II toxin-antitoxin system HicA family toxin [Nitrospirae bacterium]|nr:type II toxin-antitoxin system HicA family toxin [Nitrospirota bacterium]MBI3391922.1 type II toxin-antitoxin system HicA family toxin [Nitrospirota bacterium]